MPTTTVHETNRDETHANETTETSGEGPDAQTGRERWTTTEPGDDDASECPGPLPRDDVFSLLSAFRRRQLLQYLDENDGQTTLDEVADHIAAAENDVEVTQISSVQRKRVYVALYQCHLPKLDDAGVIAYDRNRGTIDLRERADQLFPHIYLDPGSDDEGSPWASVRSTRLYELSATIVERLGR